MMRLVREQVESGAARFAPVVTRDEPALAMPPADETSARALRLLLALSVEPHVAACCLEAPGPEPERQLWPSRLYELVAQGALRSEPVWGRCRRVLDAAFGPRVSAYAGMSPAAVQARFVAERGSASVFELAGLLWSILRRARPALGRMVARQCAELEIVSARCARAGGGVASARPPAEATAEAAPAGDRFSWIRDLASVLKLRFIINLGGPALPMSTTHR